MKTILITGATDGIGKLAASKLAADGHHLYLHGRNADKLAKVIDELEQTSDNNNIDSFVADLADLSAVKQLAAQINEQLPQLDVLINNAGVYNSRVSHSQDGFDMRFAVNFYAPLVLTEGLLPSLGRSERARVINLSSAAQAPVDLDTLTRGAEVSEQTAYAQSKLALTMWSFDFAKKHPSIGVIAVNPGSLLNTNMVKEAFGQHWSSADKGGNILYELAISDEYTDVSGVYFDNDKGDPKGAFGNAHADAYDKDKIAALMAATWLQLANFQ